jgi:hypothetical protein
MEVLKAKSVEEIKALKLSKLGWHSDVNYVRTLQVQMSDDSEAKAGFWFEITNSVLLDESRIIRKIEVFFNPTENFIQKLAFFDEAGIFLELGLLTAYGR